MAKPYSYDFRQKVIEAIELNGLKKKEASELFNISRNTINLWFQRKAETGDIKALPNLGLSKNPKIKDWEKFQTFAKEHGELTQEEMSELWSDKISPRTISRALKKIGFTRKKKLTAIKKEMRTKEQNG
jgi:transposase